MSKKVEMRHATAQRRAGDLEAARRQARKRFFRRRELMRRWRMAKDYWARCKLMKKTEAAQQVADRYGCSPSLVRHYAGIADKKGRRGLMPRSTAPHRPARRFTDAVVNLITAIRVLTGWGAQRIARNLEQQSQGQVKVSHTGVWKVIKRSHLPRRINHPRGKRDGVKYRRWGRGVRNALWHLDCKTGEGWILGIRVSMLVVIDAHSRYALAVRARLGDATADWVCQVLDECAARYGRPQDLLSDNASIFTAQVVEDWLGKPLLHSAPYYPQTNGKAEAFIRTLLRECLDLEVADRQRRAPDGQAGFSDLAELQAVLDQWVFYYNNYREHSSLGYKPPVSRYTGKTYKSLGFAAVPRLAHLDMGLVKELELPDDITPEYLQRCFALVPVSPVSAKC